MRDRTEVELALIRKHDYLPLSELGVGVTAIVQEGISVSRDECIQVLGDRLGYRRLSEGLTDRLNQAIGILLQQQKLEELDSKLRLKSD